MRWLRGSTSRATGRPAYCGCKVHLPSPVRRPRRRINWRPSCVSWPNGSASLMSSSADGVTLLARSRKRCDELLRPSAGHQPVRRTRVLGGADGHRLGDIAAGDEVSSSVPPGTQNMPSLAVVEAAYLDHLLGPQRST